MADSQAFTYDPLPSSGHIRLLRPLGKDTDGTLRFSLETHDIDSEYVGYYCLSYTWGNPHSNGVFSADHYNSVNALYDPDNNVPIVVNGRVLHVPKNLNDALDAIIPNIDPATGGDFVWTDAICINQEDIDEKSVQVGIMDKIYSKTISSLAWLGPESEDTDVGLQTLHTLITHIDEFQQSQIIPYGGRDRDSYEEAGVPFISWNKWVALAHILQRQWFRRSWIVQEALLPNRLVMFCGQRRVMWYELGLVAERIRFQEAKMGTSYSKAFSPMDQVAVAVEWNMAEIYKWRTLMSAALSDDGPDGLQYRDRFTLENLLHCFWTFAASEPRDKVFSLYGLMNVFAEKRLESDYRRSVESVYTSAARQVIREVNHIQLLSTCIFSPLRRDGLPSWVPDFSLPGMNAIPQLFTADKGLKPEIRMETEPDNPVLRIKGLYLGTVSRVGSRPSTGPGSKFLFDPSWLELAVSLIDRDQRANSEIGGKKTLISETLWRTLCMNMSLGGYYDPAKYGTQVPEEFGSQFTLLVMLLILSEADGLILKYLGEERNFDNSEWVIFNGLYNPFEDDTLASALQCLDVIGAHDGDECCLPSREEVLALWNDFEFTKARLTRGRADGSHPEIFLPSEILSGEARIVGNGYALTTSDLFERCMNFATSYNVAYGGRQLFTLNDKRLGLGPLPAEEGDEVWILPGLGAPVVLRKKKSEGNEANQGIELALGKIKLDGGCDASRYHLIGTAYVDGVMKGEAVDDEMKLEDIDLV